MFELIKIKNNTYYMKNRTNIGVYKINEKDVILIDSGIDKECGKKIKKTLEYNNLNLKIIYNTHSHADHIGGNNYLQTYYNCEIYNASIENEFVNNPFFEPDFLYGANHPKELKNKILLAEKSISNTLTKDNAHEGISLINLEGHTKNMTGFITKDNIAFLGDSLISEETLQKHPIAFLYDVNKTLETLENLKNIKANYYVPSHADITSDIFDLINVNINFINKIIKDILLITKEELTFEYILKEIFTLYNITFTYIQSILVGATLKSYITYLLNENLLTYTIKNNLIYYKSIK